MPHLRNRRQRHDRPLLALLLLGAIGSVALCLPGCAEDPPRPTFDNPFDPNTPGGADPLQLRATYADGKVTLTWTPIAGHGIETYVVYWVYLANSYELARLDASNGEMTYVVQDPVPNAVNQYLVRALDASGSGAAISHVVPAEIAVPPILRLVPPATSVRSRRVDLVVRSARGVYVQVDTSRSFATAVEAAIRPDSTAVFASFDLGPRPSAAARCTVFARAELSGAAGGQDATWSPVGKLVVSISFNPTILRPDSTSTVAEPWTDLVISHAAAGVQSVRFAASEARLADAPWRPGAPLVERVALLDTPAPQTLHAELLSEFGFTRRTTLELVGDDLGGAGFALLVPANRVSPTRRIAISCDAVATEMRISQYPDFRDAPWRPYADSYEISLQGEPGLFQIFAWFRNHWYESAILTEHVILAGAGPRIAFTNPTAGQSVPGGTTIQLAGIASTDDGDRPVTLVQVHLGDEWQAADGTDHWSALWSIPAVEEATVQRLGARAIQGDRGGDDVMVATTWIEVTITPPGR